MLLAAGSGITPTISILRNLDDLCLDTHVTLLYCVRARADIIFAWEFEDLRTRLKNFEYHFLLSRPDSEWKGASGHLSHKFIGMAVPDLNDRVFFLCGPPAFMETTRHILLDMGVAPERTCVGRAVGSVRLDA